MFTTHHVRRCRPCQFIVAGWAATLLSLLAFVSSATAKPLAPTPAFENASPFTLTIIDPYNEPLERLDLRVTITAPGVWPDGELPVIKADNVLAPGGVVTLMLPPSCDLTIDAVEPGAPMLPRAGSRFRVLDGEPREATLQVSGRPCEGLIVNHRTGEPVVGALVVPRYFAVPHSAPSFESAVETDDRGHFRLPGVTHWGFDVVHPDFVYERQLRLGSENCSGLRIHSKDAEIRLDPGRSVPIRVVDHHANPLATATIQRRRWHEPQSVAADGSFVISGIPPVGASGHGIRMNHADSFLVSAPGFGSREIAIPDAEHDPEAPMVVEMRPASENQLQIINNASDPQRSEFTVRVINPDGKPARVFDLQLTVRTPGLIAEGAIERIARDNIQSDLGVVSLELPEAFSMDITASSTDGPFDRHATAGVRIDPGEVREVTLMLRDLPTMRGIVVDDATGEPLAGATVAPQRFARPHYRADRSRATITDQHGRFELRGVESRVLWAHHPGYVQCDVYQLADYLTLHESPDAGPPKPLSGSVRLAQDETLIRLQPAPEYHGRVVDQAGRPIPGAVLRVSEDREAIHADADGEFTFHYESAFNRFDMQLQSFFVSAPGFQPQVTHAEISRHATLPVEFKLLPSRLLRIRVVDVDGQPVEAVETYTRKPPLLAFAVGAGTNLVGQWHQTEDGWISIELVDTESTFSLGLRSHSTPLQWFRAHLGEPGTARATLAAVTSGSTITLADGTRLHGLVMSSQNIPEDAIVELTMLAWNAKGARRDEMVEACCVTGIADEHMVFTAPLDTEGGFEFTGVPAGSFVLNVIADGLAAEPVHITIEGEGKQRVPPLTLLATGVLHGTAIDENDDPLAYQTGWISRAEPLRCGCTFTIGQESHAIARFVTDAEGRFTVTGVPPGSVRIGFMGFMLHNADPNPSITVRPGSINEASIRFHTVRDGAWHVLMGR